MEYRGDHGPGPEGKDLREVVVMLMRSEDRYARLQRDLEKLDAQVNSEGGIKDRLAETRIISAERYKNAMRTQRCISVVAGVLLAGFITWVTVQFWQIRDRDMARQLLPPAVQQGAPSLKGP